MEDMPEILSASLIKSAPHYVPSRKYVNHPLSPGIVMPGYLMSVLKQFLYDFETWNAHGSLVHQ